MDKLTRSWFEMAFRNRYLECKGSEFQGLFSTIMEMGYPSDFIRVRPWGKVGDRKNDGFLASKRTLFQVYAPNELKQDEAIAKIDEDFQEALPYWGSHFDIWTFVHNSPSGLGPDVTNRLLSLKTTNQGKTISWWGYEELKQEVFNLSSQHLESLLGYPPSQEAMNGVSYESIRAVVEQVARNSVPIPPTIRPVPLDKLSANGLSDAVRDLLSAGMRKADTVKRFFEDWYDPGYGDSIAASFRERYIELRDRRKPPDTIFSELHALATGPKRLGPDHEAAALAVLAFLFEQCEIFEEPR